MELIAVCGECENNVAIEVDGGTVTRVFCDQCGEEGDGAELREAVRRTGIALLRQEPVEKVGRFRFEYR